MAKYRHVAASILGLFFLVSGVGKALDLGQFADTIALYGLPQLRFMAPLVTALEIGLGVGLLAQLQLRRLALASLVLLAGFTLLFAYGYLWHDVTSCGCFGAFEALQTPPWVSFTRNAALLLVAGWLFYGAPATGPALPARNWQGGGLALLTGLGVVVLSYVYLHPGQTAHRRPLVAPGQVVRTSVLAEFCPADAKATTLLFIFSPTCSHCWAATPQVLAYQKQGLVRDIIALCPPSTQAEQQKYLQHFGQPFAIQVVDRDKLHQITDQVPTAILIRQNKVVRVLTAHLPAADSLAMTLAPGGRGYASLF